MSGSSPSDLAITFRSLPRRLREAQGEVPIEAIDPQLADIDRHLERARTLLGSNPDAASIATAIDARAAGDWTDQLLGELQGIALAIGGALRSINAANPDAET